MNGVEVPAEVQHDLVEVLVPLDARQPEEVLDLPHRDDDGDAGGETGRHRVRHELDQPAQPRQPVPVVTTTAMIETRSRVKSQPRNNSQIGSVNI